MVERLVQRPLAIRGLVLAGLAFGALLGPVGALLGPVGAAADSSFRTPSKRIYCAYTAHPDFLRCDVNYATRFTHRPGWCHFDWGHAFGLRPTGGAQVLCVSDSTYSLTAKVIPYGTTRHYGPFTCTSKSTGLRCQNQRGHGFRLSRSQQTLF